MSQRGVQLVIGSLLTDGEFRRRLERGGSTYLAGLRKQGFELTREEIAALTETDPDVWSSMSRRVDHRLQNGGLSFEREGQNPGLRLTDRQQQVLAGICEGLRNKDIAVRLGVSEGAVKATVQQLFHKASVRKRVKLVRLALEESLRTSRQA